jgi:hypothetical protein|tara:strand:+ start:302 stop:523 length:222 start_codon:yes stop_codon:yes gene_type:complete
MKLRIKKQVGEGYQVIDLDDRLDLGALGMTDIPIEVFKTKEEAEKYIAKMDLKEKNAKAIELMNKIAKAEGVG